jgi:hypothetical protein
MAKKNILLILLVLVLSLSFIYAQPPHQQSPQLAGYLILETGSKDYHKLGNDFYVHVHVYNGDNGLLQTNDVICKYRFYNFELEGEQHIAIGNLTQHGDGFFEIVNGDVINTTGQYGVLVWCYEEGVEAKGGFFQYNFLVTPYGEEIGESQSIILIGFLGFIILLISISYSFEKKKWKIRAFLHLFALFTGVIMLNSIRILSGASYNLYLISGTALTLGIVLVSFMIMYILILYTIEVFNYFKKKNRSKWEVGDEYD